MTQFSSLYGELLSRELANDDSTILFTDSRRKHAINEGQEEFADLTECLTVQSSVTLTGGTGEYDLNTQLTGFSRLSKQQVEFRYTDASSNVTVLAGDDLPRKDPLWLNRYRPGWQVSTTASSVTQYPEFHYIRIAGPRYYLGFTPVPSTGSSAAMEAVVPYVAVPNVMTSDTNEPYTVSGLVRTDLRPYHMALVHYAAHQLEKLRRDQEASATQYQKFLGYVAKYTASLRIKGGTALTTARSYFRSARGAGGVVEDPRS